MRRDEVESRLNQMLHVWLTETACFDRYLGALVVADQGGSCCRERQREHNHPVGNIISGASVLSSPVPPPPGPLGGRDGAQSARASPMRPSDPRSARQPWVSRW